MRVAICDDNQQDIERIRRYTSVSYTHLISGYVMTLTTGKKIPVPKARYAQVKREYMLYKGEIGRAHV